MLATADASPFPIAWNGDPAAIMERVAQIGYDGIELQVRDPALIDPNRMSRFPADTGLSICGLSTGQAATIDGLFLITADPIVRRRAIDRFRAVLELAAAFHCHASIGYFRGDVKSAGSRAIGVGWLTDALNELIPRADQLGVRIVLEPMRRDVRDFLNTVDETIAYIRTFDSHVLAFEGDLHHQQTEERSLIASIVAGVRSGLMWHVQVSDSNWLAPGWGNFNWVDIMETLRASGYDRWIACECLQQPDSERSAVQAYATMRNALGP